MNMCNQLWAKGALVFAAISLMPMIASAAEGAAAPSGGASEWAPLGAGLAIGLAVLGGGLGQGKAASAAYESIARNPQANLFVPLILGLVFIESLVIYALLIAFKIVG